MKRACSFVIVVLLVITSVCLTALADEPSATADNFNRDRLVAWCIVPFDAKQRGPEARAIMVQGLGMTRVAYDWRDVHVPTFEEEIVQYKKHNIEFFAFWGWHDAFEPLIEKHGIHPQIWIMFGAPSEGTHEEKIKAAAEGLLPLVEKTRKYNLKLALYNHGGWSGEPQNMVAVCEYLRDHHQADHVGIVYNLHHGHDHIADFAEQLALLQPHLLCLNLNGMNDNANPKILPIGDGQHDEQLISVIRRSGYTGPIGIIDHREQLDAQESLMQNLTGLRKVLEKLGDKAAAATFDSK
jgi:sugar phosphate isomerase/epimerase